MSTREREPRERGRLGQPGSGGPGVGVGGEGPEAGQRVRDLLEAGDRAIERALSKDSARFLEQNRQTGGQ